MTAPVNNANLTAPAARDTRQSSPRPADSAQARTNTPDLDDRVSLSTRPAESTSDSSIQNQEEANKTLARIKELIAADPAAALAGHHGLNATAAAGVLRTAA